MSRNQEQQPAVESTFRRSQPVLLAVPRSQQQPPQVSPYPHITQTASPQPAIQQQQQQVQMQQQAQPKKSQTDAPFSLPQPRSHVPAGPQLSGSTQQPQPPLQPPIQQAPSLTTNSNSPPGDTQHQHATGDAQPQNPNRPKPLCEVLPNRIYRLLLPPTVPGQRQRPKRRKGNSSNMEREMANLEHFLHGDTCVTFHSWETIEQNAVYEAQVLGLPSPFETAATLVNVCGGNDTTKYGIHLGQFLDHVNFAKENFLTLRVLAHLSAATFYECDFDHNKCCRIFLDGAESLERVLSFTKRVRTTTFGVFVAHTEAAALDLEKVHFGSHIPNVPYHSIPIELMRTSREAGRLTAMCPQQQLPVHLQSANRNAESVPPMASIHALAAYNISRQQGTQMRCLPTGVEQLSGLQPSAPLPLGWSESQGQAIPPASGRVSGKHAPLQDPTRPPIIQGGAAVIEPVAPVPSYVATGGGGGGNFHCGAGAGLAARDENSGPGRDELMSEAKGAAPIAPPVTAPPSETPFVAPSLPATDEIPLAKIHKADITPELDPKDQGPKQVIVPPVAEPVELAATVTGGGGGTAPPRRSRFFVSGTILIASWGPGSAEELEDEYPGVEFEVHKSKAGKKATITIVAPSKVVLRGVVETMLEQVGGALALDEEIYRELPSGDCEGVGTLATAPSTTGMEGSKSNSNVEGVSAGTPPQPVSNAAVPGSAGQVETQSSPSQPPAPLSASATAFNPKAPVFNPKQEQVPIVAYRPGADPPNYSPGTKLVVDPMSTKLAIPFDSIHQTESDRRQGGHGIPSLCLLFMDNRCRKGERCYQVHADINVVLALRAQAYATAGCCMQHGAQSNMPEYWKEKYLILFQGGTGNPYPITRLVITAGLQSYVDQYEQLNGPPPEGSDAQICLCIDASHICRMSGIERCRFGEECKYLHLCRELLYSEIPSKSKAYSVAPKVETPPLRFPLTMLIQGTIDALGALISKPKLTQRLLSKPPFRFLIEIVDSVHTEHPHVFQKFEPFPPDLDLSTLEGNNKIAWLERIFAEVGAGLGRAVDCSASHVIAGLQPERTNLFLQELAALVNLPPDTRKQGEARRDQKLADQKAAEVANNKKFATRPRSYLEQQNMEPTQHKDPQHATLDVSETPFAIPGLVKATNSVDSSTAISNKESPTTYDFDELCSNSAPSEQVFPVVEE